MYKPQFFILLLCGCLRGQVSALHSTTQRGVAVQRPGTVQRSGTYDLLSSISVVDAASGSTLSLTSCWPQRKGRKTVVAFLTHFADFNAFEYAQQLRHYLPVIDDTRTEVVAVGIGTLAAAHEFASITSFPLSNLYADESGAAYKALGFSSGFKPPVKLNPYMRLGTMLTGIGSPGTLQAVISGYIGNRDTEASWTESTLELVDKSRFDALGKQGARPFEIATVRLQNMVQILKRWQALSPPDKELITQQGGTLIFDGKDVIWRYDDAGILVYTDIQEVLRVIGAEQLGIAYE